MTPLMEFKQKLTQICTPEEFTVEYWYAGRMCYYAEIVDRWGRHVGEIGMEKGTTTWRIVVAAYGVRSIKFEVDRVSSALKEMLRW